MFSLIVTLPDAPASVPVIGGTSLAVVNVMVNVGNVLDGLVGESSHATTIVMKNSATIRKGVSSVSSSKRPVQKNLRPRLKPM